MRLQATDLSRSFVPPIARLFALLLGLALLGPIACKQQSPQSNNAGAQNPAQTLSVFEEPDPFTMPDPHQKVGLLWDLPEGWEAFDDFRSFRLATWRVPGDNEGVFAFAFYMGSAMEGAIESNASRWSLQVHNADESRPEPEISSHDLGPLTVTFIRIDGDWVFGMTQTELELGSLGGSLLGVVVEGGPAGNVFFRLSGPKSRVDELRPAFEGMIESIRIMEGFEAP